MQVRQPPNGERCGLCDRRMTGKERRAVVVQLVRIEDGRASLPADRWCHVSCADEWGEM